MIKTDEFFKCSALSIVSRGVIVGIKNLPWLVRAHPPNLQHMLKLENKILSLATNFDVEFNGLLFAIQ